MNNSLGNQFSKFLSDEDFYAANEIIKQARALNYPSGLINSWETSLANLEPGIRHPLDSVQEPKPETIEGNFIVPDVPEM